jgi:serine/threonine-protein kinase
MTPSPSLTAALGGRYQVLSEAGRGGSATVYRARDRKHQRDVALKVLHPHLAAALAAERFLREIETTASLNHPHILPLLDSGATDGILYFAIPFIDGPTLRDRLRSAGPLPLPEVIRILIDVADALQYAHAQGVIHRDIKPENILLSGRHALVADFGVARATGAAGRHLTTGVAIGTPSYMAPEQALAQPDVDHRVDIYALGIVGYELLTGRPPFLGDSPQQVLTAQVVRPPEPIERFRAGVPAELLRVVDRCLAKDPAERWSSAAEILATLDPLATPPSGTIALVPRRKTFGLVSGAVALVVLVGAGATWWGGWSGARPGGQPAVVGQQMISFTGDVRDAAISPDGVFLAEVRQKGAGQRIVVVDRQGGGPALELVSGHLYGGLRWSAGGDQIYYSDAGAGLVVRAIPRFGGLPRLVGHGRGDLSPNARWLLGLPTPDAGTAILTRTDTGAAIQVPLPRARAWALDVVWNRHSSRAAVLTTTGDRLHATITVIDTTGRPGRDIVLDGTVVLGLVWAPTGDSLFYLERRGSVALLHGLPIQRDGSAGDAVALASGLPATAPVAVFATTLTVTADGRSVVYARSFNVANLLRGSARDGRVDSIAPLTTGSAEYELVTVSPEGDRLAALRREAGLGTWLGVLPPAGGPVENLALFADAIGAQWSPNGETIAVTGARPGEPQSLYLVRPNGRVTIATRGPIGDGIAWLGDDTVAVQDELNRSWRAVSLRAAEGVGGSSRPLLAGDSGWTFDLRVGPDRRSFAYTLNRGRGRSGMLVTDTSGVRRMEFPGVNVLRWAPDGRSVYALSQRNEQGVGVLYRVPVDGGTPTVVARAPAGVVIDDIAPGGTVVFGRSLSSQGDVWLIRRR